MLFDKVPFDKVLFDETTSNKILFNKMPKPKLIKSAYSYRPSKAFEVTEATLSSLINVLLAWVGPGIREQI